MYTFLLVVSILALTLCPLLLDAILTRKETRRSHGAASRARRAAHLTLVSTRAR